MMSTTILIVTLCACVALGWLLRGEYDHLCRCRRGHLNPTPRPRRKNTLTQ